MLRGCESEVRKSRSVATSLLGGGGRPCGRRRRRIRRRRLLLTLSAFLHSDGLRGRSGRGRKEEHNLKLCRVPDRPRPQATDGGRGGNLEVGRLKLRSRGGTIPKQEICAPRILRIHLGLYRSVRNWISSLRNPRRGNWIFSRGTSVAIQEWEAATCTRVDCTVRLRESMAEVHETSPGF